MKTGTTTIQHFLFGNRTRLEQIGILYPRVGLYKKDSFGVRHKRLTHSGHDNVERWRKLDDELSQAETATAIISCEAFWRYPERAAELARRFAAFEVTVVIGLRRQDKFLASMYLQRRRHFEVEETPSELMANRYHDLRYFETLGIWAAAFGQEAIRPFLYDESGRDVLPAFLDAAGLQIGHRGFSATGARKNISPEPWTAAQVLGEDLISMLLDHSAEGNARLFATYFPSAEGWPGLNEP